jgi:hypothetical protein
VNSRQANQSDEARRHIERALHAAQEGGADAAVVRELRAALSALSNPDAQPVAGNLLAPRRVGYLDRTLEDEQFAPNGREFDVRVHYDWIDFSRGDATTPSGGGYAVIVDVEVLGVRYFDDHGHVIDTAQYHDDAATALARQQWDQLEEACTEQGARSGAGETSPLYFTAPRAAAAHAGPRKMAPSARQRGASHEQRKLG